MSTGLTIPVWEFRDAQCAWLAVPPAGPQDVIVIGAGVAGLTTALCLLREGRNVLLVERHDIGAGETGRTTAHLASALDDRFHLLARHHGREGARLAAASHAAAVDWIEALAGTNEDCGFARVPGYLFSHDGSLQTLEKEARSAEEAGLAVSYLRNGIPGLEHLGPVLRFDDQARMDMGRYLSVLAREVRNAGCAFLLGEATRVCGGEQPTVEVEGHVLQARSVVVATNVPFHDTTSTFHKQAPYRTYAIAGKMERAAVPDALYWDDGDPYHYVRLHESGEEDTYLIVGGCDHKTGQEDDPVVYRRLQDWARKRFPAVGTFTHGWSGQVLEPADGLAFIGADPKNRNVYLVTGDSGNGITHGTFGGMLIRDLITGKDNECASLYDPGRQMGTTPEWFRENANVAMQYADWLRPAHVDDPNTLALGTGTVLRRGLHRVAVYRDGNGVVHAHNARCPHLGCVVRWSSEEKSWDCPCHGSRFEAVSGAILNGPTNAPLEPFDLDVATDSDT